MFERSTKSGTSRSGGSPDGRLIRCVPLRNAFNIRSASSMVSILTPRCNRSSEIFYNSLFPCEPTRCSPRVESKMKLAKDKKSLTVNDSLTLSGIPPEAFNYRLGNRSALEWVIDQYQVYTDKRTGITSDPNAWGEEHGHPEYIVELVARVITVSLETQEIVHSLPEKYAP